MISVGARTPTFAYCSQFCWSATLPSRPNRSDQRPGLTVLAQPGRTRRLATVLHSSHCRFGPAEVKEKKDRVDALNAIRAAIEEGIVAGGVALVGVSLAIAVTGANAALAVIAIVRRAVQTPTRQITSNAGAEALIVVGKILDNREGTFGFDT